MGFRVGLLYTRFAGMAQALYAALRDDGHEVVRPEDAGLRPPLTPDGMVAFANLARADVLFCPFLKEIVPATVCKHWTTWIPHPGIRGDRGPSSLSWAILDQERTWGLTMVRAEPAAGPDDLDAGNVGAWREFPLPADATVGEVYQQRVIPAAVACAREILEAMERDPGFAGAPLDPAEARGRRRPVLRQERLAFGWDAHPDEILRRVRAATFGVRAELAGRPVNVYDAHRHGGAEGVWHRPGELVARRDGALLVAAAGSGSIWIGRAKAKLADGGQGLKLPATDAVAPRAATVPESPADPARRLGGRRGTYQPIRYRRSGNVGWIHAEPYDGALSTAFCERLLDALRHAAARDTDVIAVTGGRAAWNNGVHLGVIEAAEDPDAEAWANIQAIDDVAELIFNLPRGRDVPRRQTTVAVLNASAGAGGAVLSACFEVVLARPAINLNYHYATMGLSGSELRSLALPLRAGEDAAAKLLADCLPISPAEAKRLGLVDDVGPEDPDEFDRWATETVTALAAEPREALPLVDPSLHRKEELDEMWHDIFEDRLGFAARRRAFLGLPDPAA